MQKKSHKFKQLFFSNNIEPDGILPCIFVYTEEVDRNTFDKFQNKTKIKPFWPHRNAFLPFQNISLKHTILQDIPTSAWHSPIEKNMLSQKCCYSMKD